MQEAKAAAAALVPPPEVASFQAAKEVFDEVSKHHPVLRGVLETLIQEVRLLCVFCAFCVCLCVSFVLSCLLAGVGRRHTAHLRPIHINAYPTPAPARRRSWAASS